MKTFWNTLLTFFIKNWKTTLGGILVAVATSLLTANVIDAQTFAIILGILTSLGLIAAKDGDKTGINSSQIVN